jgi:hypothetical protein
MKRKILILVLMIFAMGFLAFYVADRVTAATEQQKSAGNSAQDLHSRVGKLEAQVAALQAQIKVLSSKASSQVLTVPGTYVFPGNKIPPGAKEREISGIKYWIIPLNEGH